MPTEVLRTLKASGGDYTSVQTWAAANGGATSKDLVANDENVVLEFYKGDYTSVGGGVNYIDENLDDSGWTCDATRNITLKCPDSEMHDGTPESGFWWQKTGDTTVLRLQATFCNFYGLDLALKGCTVTYRQTYNMQGAADSIVERCLFRGDTSASAGNVITASARRVSFINSLFIGTGGNTSVVKIPNYSWSDLESCTIVGDGTTTDPDGIINDDAGTDVTVHNTVYWGDGDFESGSGGFGTSGNNASKTYTTTAPPGTDNYTSNVVSGDFEDTSNDDYHLSSSSNLIDAGENRTSVTTEDVDGDARPGSGDWDIGFDHYASSSQSVNMGIASETDSALAMGITVGLGIASETDSALPVTPSTGQIVALGIASETDSALSITPTAGQMVALGIATEADSALGVGMKLGIGIASETDTALPITPAVVTNAGARFEIVNGALPASGTVQLTKTGFGTPKQVVLFVNYATIDATVASHMVLSIGGMDDTVEASAGISIQDATGGNSNTHRCLNNSLSSAPVPGASSTLDWEINGTLITDGVELSITNAPSSAHLCTALLIGGDDVEQVEVIVQDDLGAAAGDVTVNLAKVWATPPSGLFNITQNGNTPADMVGANAAFSFGFSNFSDHGSVTVGGVQNTAGEFQTGYISDQYSLAQAFLASPIAWGGYPHSPTVNDFKFNMSASGGNDIAIFVVFGLAADKGISIDRFSIPTDADVTVPTTVSPTFNMVLTLEGATAYDSFVDNTDLAFGIAMFDGSDIGVLTGSVTDATTNSAKSLHSDSLLLLDSAGAAAEVGGIPSFGSGSVTWTTSTRPTGQNLLGMSFTVGSVVAVSGVVADEIFRVYGIDIASALATHFNKGANESLQDAERRWLIAQGGSGGQLGDMWKELYAPNSTVQQAQLIYWQSQ